MPRPRRGAGSRSVQFDLADVVTLRPQRGDEGIELLAIALAALNYQKLPFLSQGKDYSAYFAEAGGKDASKIDELIETYSEAWPLSRMPAVDRGLARIGIYEILFEQSVPDAATIDEIVTLAASLSTDESPAFLNGLLSRISGIKGRINLD